MEDNTKFTLRLYAKTYLTIAVTFTRQGKALTDIVAIWSAAVLRHLLRLHSRPVRAFLCDILLMHQCYMLPWHVISSLNQPDSQWDMECDSCETTHALSAVTCIGTKHLREAVHQPFLAGPASECNPTQSWADQRTQWKAVTAIHQPLADESVQMLSTLPVGPGGGLCCQ